nr:immunoglobulin light chain junction region [Macaca mulatta]MOV66090.1 immunoglobulin light chain junction region [Macaca mulatta]MOV67179.1 immunoglobulin light chain junction region [Macaca mulatta]MOV67711.1 immunoglobulin light chain junction region [Macaca mulatta]MOV68058.1 immunoglobulin light chain junction region [Macaca mulatta]
DYYCSIGHSSGLYIF